MKDKKNVNNIKNRIEKLDKTQNLGDNIMAGRTSPTPQFSLKPKIVVKPKNQND